MKSHIIAKSFPAIWARRLAVAVLALIVALGAWVYWQSRGLPSVGNVQRDFRTHFPAQKGPHWVPLSAISPKLRAAVVASEDGSFYRHAGLDYDELWASLLTDVRTHEFRRGGSTITQQVAKNAYLGPQKTIRRKVREAILARRIERALSKDQILETYLNLADWGDGIVGAESAAHYYFAKTPGELSWSESALLAAILSNPHRLNPLTAPREVLRLRDVVLLKLLLARDITPEEYAEATCAPLPRGSLPSVRAAAAHREVALPSWEGKAPSYLAGMRRAVRRWGLRAQPAASEI